MAGTILSLSLVGFMVGNLLTAGLELAVADAVRALRDRRFVAIALVWAFAIGPALAWGLLQLFPIGPGYGIGLLLMGLTPCAPFAPMMARRAGGDPGSMAALMLITALGTVVVMPVAVPLMVDGLAADAWTIAKPLLYYVLAPLAAGMAIRHAAAALAARLFGVVKRVTTLVTVVMIGAMMALYGPAMLGAVGTGAIALQILYLGLMTVVPYVAGLGLRGDQRSVLGLALGTRNFGAALAPLVASPGTDPSATAMIAVGVPITVLLSAAAARWFARDGARA